MIGQMPLWSEQSSGENLDSIVWPRLCAGAEVFWTGEVLPDGTSRIGECHCDYRGKLLNVTPGENATSGVNAFRRLNEHRFRLVDRGIRAIALQPKWCVLRPGLCDA